MSLTPARRTWEEIAPIRFLLHNGRARSFFKRLESRGELKSYADGTVEGTSQAEVPSTEGPLGRMA